MAVMVLAQGVPSEHEVLRSRVPLTLGTVQALGSVPVGTALPLWHELCLSLKKRSSSHQQTFIEHHCVPDELLGPAHGGDSTPSPQGRHARLPSTEARSSLWVTRAQRTGQR